MNYAVTADIVCDCFHDSCGYIEFEKYVPDDPFMEVKPEYVFFPYGIYEEQQITVKSDTEWYVI
jgi:hypothetical protein